MASTEQATRPCRWWWQLPTLVEEMSTSQSVAERPALDSAAETEYQIPNAFRRAFAPTLIERVRDLVLRARQAVSGWLDRYSDGLWQPRASTIWDTAHEQAWLGEYGLFTSRGVDRTRRVIRRRG